MRNTELSNNAEAIPWIAVTGGGTAGHIYPALSVLDALNSAAGAGSAYKVVWIGSKSGMERGIVTNPEAGNSISYEAIPTGKLRRYASLKNIVDLFRIVAGFVRSLSILRKYRPVVVFAKGGYVSVPPVIAAKVLGIPIVCHESDIDPGLATRINGKFAGRILVAYESSRQYFSEDKQPKIFAVGVPIRDALMNASSEKGREYIGTECRKPVLLVVGGSQGALQLNEFVELHIDELCESWHVVHQTGPRWERTIVHENYRAFTYLGAEYGDVLSAADCVLCRSGATTVWEAAVLEKAMVLVPLGLETSRGDQIRNARYFGERNAAVVIDEPEGDLSGGMEMLSRLAGDENERQRLGREAKKLVRTDSAERIAEFIFIYLDGEQQA